MKKRVRIVIVSTVALVAVAVLALFVWYQTGGAARLLKSRVVASLAEMNIRAEIADSDLALRPGSVRFEGVKLYPGSDSTPIATIDQINVTFDITSLWSRTVELKTVELVHPVVNITFDENGLSNLDAIKMPESTGGDAESPANVQATIFTLRDGQFNYGDKANRIDGSVTNLLLSVAPKAGEPLQRRVEASFSGSKLTVNDREVPEIGMQLAADVSETGAQVENVELTTPLGVVKLAGTVSSWAEMTYDFNVGSTISMDRIGAIIDPAAGLSGGATLNGHVSGTGTKYRFDGELAGNDLLVSGARIDGLKITGPVEGDDSAYAWGAGQVVASRLTMAGYDVSNLKFAGRVDGTGLNAVANGAFTAGAFRGGGAVGGGASFTGTASSDGRRVEGNVGLDSLLVRTVRAGSIRAKIAIDGDTLDVPTFTAVVYGGSVTGSARAKLAETGSSTLSARFTNIDIDNALGAASADAPHLSGLATGTISLAWPGTRVQQSTGKVNATVNGNLDGKEGVIPVDGTIAMSATPGKFVIDSAEFRSGGSSVTATGTIGWDRKSDIRLTANAPVGSDLLALVSAASPSLGKELESYQVRIGGGFSFDGHVTGNIVDPIVDGNVTVGDVRIGDPDAVEIGTFTGAIRRDAAGVELDGAKIVRIDGGEIAFDLSLPSSAARPRHIDARLTRFPLEALRNFPGVPQNDNLRGLLSGTFELSLPALPADAEMQDIANRARGHIDVSIEGATMSGQPLTELRFAAVLGEDDVNVSAIRLVSARGELSGAGRFVRASSGYDFAFDAKNMDLKLIESAVTTEGKAPPVNLSGTANGKVSISGVYEDSVNTVRELSGDVRATDVVVNGEPFGDPRLEIGTVNGIATVTVSADVRGTRRELAGTIALNEEGTPFRVAAGLENFNAMTLSANPPTGVSTRLTGNVLVTGFVDDIFDSGGIRERLAVSGSMSALELNVEVDEARKSYTLSNQGDVVFNVANNVLHFDRATFTGEGTALSLAGDIALDQSAVSNLTLTGDVSLALVSSFSRQAYADGVATLQASVAGTLAEPRFSGFADIRNASLRLVNVPVAIQEGEGRILFTSNQALIDRFTARANGGRVNVDGGVLFEGLKPDRWRFGIEASQVRMTYPDDVRSVVDGDLTLQGNMRLMVLSGAVTLRRAEFTREIELRDFLDLDGRGSSTTYGNRPARTSTSPIRLDIAIEARDSLIIRNSLADVVASASLVVTGPIDDPIIDGRATVSRGVLNFRDTEYQVIRGVARFPGRLGGEITIDLLAEAEIKGYRVSIGITGTPDKPFPVLRSEPPLPETQIASLVLTGDLSSEEITTSSVAQSGVNVASSIVSAAVSRSVEKRTSKLFGINRFQIDPVLGRTDPSARLTVGRRVNKNLSIIYSTNLSSTQEQVIQLEYRISDRFSLVATRDEDGAFGLDFRVRKRF